MDSFGGFHVFKISHVPGKLIDNFTSPGQLLMRLVF